MSSLGFPAKRGNLFAKICTFTHFVRAKNAKISAKKNCENFTKKNFVKKLMGRFVGKKYGGEIINHYIIKLLMLSREFHKFFAQLIVAATKLVKFCIVFACFRLIHFREKNSKFDEKVCEILTNIFALFRESFRSLGTLVVIKVYSFVHNKTFFSDSLDIF